MTAPAARGRSNGDQEVAMARQPLRALYRAPDIDGVGRSPKNRRVPARVFSAALVGVEAVLVRVEVDVASGLPAFTTVGLPDLAVRESRERVRTAIRNAGFGVLSFAKTPSGGQVVDLSAVIPTKRARRRFGEGQGAAS
jgi:hypothetical protein